MIINKFPDRYSALPLVTGLVPLAVGPTISTTSTTSTSTSTSTVAGREARGTPR